MWVQSLAVMAFRVQVEGVRCGFSALAGPESLGLGRVRVLLMSSRGAVEKSHGQDNGFGKL